MEFEYAVENVFVKEETTISPMRKELEEIENNISKWSDAKRDAELIAEYYTDKIWEAQMRHDIIVKNFLEGK